MPRSLAAGMVAGALAWAGPSGTAAAGPRGRVVRVERSGSSRIPPRLCEIHGHSGNCIGDEPHPGQIVAVLDERHVVAQVEIVETSSFSPSCPMLWAIQTQPARGGAADTDGIGVIDPSLDLARAHLVDRARMPSSLGALPEEEVWRAIDRDGDGAADILITRYGCDSSGRPTTTGTTFCIDVWARTGARMTRTTQLNFALCNR